MGNFVFVGAVSCDN